MSQTSPRPESPSCISLRSTYLVYVLQDAPTDTTPAYLASLTSTKQILAFLSRSCAARRTITANAPPVEQQEVALPHQRTRAPEQHFYWTWLFCSEVAFSVCGRWLAAALVEEQDCSLQPEHRQAARLPSTIEVYDVVLLDTEHGFRELARFCTGTSVPVIEWDPTCAHLSVTHLPKSRQFCYESGVEPDHALAVPSTVSAAFVVEGPTGEVLHSVTGEAAARLQNLHGVNECHLTWSPSAQRLLVQGQRPLHQLSVLDVYQNKVLATSKFYSNEDKNDEEHHSEAWHAAAWHPDSAGIALSFFVELEDPGAFRHVGIILGRLPPPFCVSSKLHQTDNGFSNDARHSLAGYWALAGPDEGLTCVHALLSCKIRCQQICFTLVEHLMRGYLIYWVPRSLLLLAHPCSDRQDCILVPGYRFGRQGLDKKSPSHASCPRGGCLWTLLIDARQCRLWMWHLEI